MHGRGQEELVQAKKRFGEAWKHQDGDHPISDSAEAQKRGTAELRGLFECVPSFAVRFG